MIAVESMKIWGWAVLCDMPKSPSSQYGLKAQEDIDPRGLGLLLGL
jgi:hypothetical protein